MTYEILPVFDQGSIGASTPPDYYRIQAIQQTAGLWIGDALRNYDYETEENS